MISPVRLTKLIAALGVLSLTACGAESVTVPGATLAPTGPSRDVCSGYSLANGKC